MPDGERPSADEESFAAFVREGARELREQRGPCPSDDELRAFQRRSLPEHDAERVRGHVEACGLCDAHLARLKPPPLRWRAWTLLSHPALAYSLVAILAYPAWRGLRIPEFSSLDRAARPVRDFSLDRTRGSEVAAIRVGDAEPYWLLSFFIPVKANAEYHYEAEVRNGKGETIVRAPEIRGDPLGNFHLLCARRAFPPGRYELLVNESGPGNPKLIASFPFAVAQ